MSLILLCFMPAGNVVSYVLVSYGVDLYRVRRMVGGRAEQLLEDMCEDDAPWFKACDRRYESILRELGASSSVDVMRGVLCNGELVESNALYAELVGLLCEYVGQRLSSEPFEDGVPWDDGVEGALDDWFRAHDADADLLGDFDVSCLSFAEVELVRGFKHKGVGWLGVEQCEALDDFFTSLRGDENDEDVEEFWDEELCEDDEFDVVVRCLESWVLMCRERGWAMATFYRAR